MIAFPNMEADSPLALLRATFGHEYYSGGFTEFKIGPLPATAIACRKLGLRLLRSGSEVTLYIGVDMLKKATTTDYRGALAATTLCWQIAPVATDFAAFTGIDLAAASECLVFTRAKGSLAGGSLTVGSVASAKDVWPRQGLRYDYRPVHPLKAGAELVVQTSAGVPLFQFVVTDPTLVTLDLSDFGSGLYELVQGKRVLTRWFADERGLSPNAPSSLLVLPGSLLVSAFANALGNMSADTQLPIYTATYPARSVIWRYRVFNTEAGEELSIVPFSGEALSTPADEDAPAASAKKSKSGKTAQPRKSASSRAAFVAVDDPALPDAQSFEALRPLKLAQRPAQRFALQSAGDTRYAPLPLGGMAFGRSLRSSAICAEIFVYL